MNSRIFYQYSALIFASLLTACTSLDEQNTVDEYQYQAYPTIEQPADLADSDGDGVINARDLCQETAGGSKINNDGCGKMFNSNQQQQLHILFAHNSSVVNPIFVGQIKQMATFMASYPSSKIEINGYASKVGTEETNLTLSKERAEAVKQALVTYGVEPDRISIIGYGEQEPEVDEESEIADTKNRRVTATVVTHDNVIEKEWTIFSRLPKDWETY
ncbi:OmpA family protein [Vibrio sp.]|nr:OmpA family protein [Vibrio sp.]